MDLDPQTLEHYRLKLRYKVYYHLGSFCPDVEDVVQESLVRFVNALREQRIQKPESAGAFLSGICNNVILEYQRRIWREGPGEAPAEAATLVAPEAEAMELQEEVSAALAQLSDRDSEILRAFYLQERDKEEICRSTGLTDSQFRVALFRAKERFRKIYRGGMKRQAPGPH
jgi:RNA polymerase sigma-70 factor (ECF subfamily)